jgi:hypothetical protein
MHPRSALRVGCPSGVKTPVRDRDLSHTASRTNTLSHAVTVRPLGGSEAASHKIVNDKYLALRIVHRKYYVPNKIIE